MKRALRRTMGRLNRLRRPTAAAIADLGKILDPKWYLERYPDVAAAGMPPLSHFIEHGVHEGRRPNAFVDPDWYARVYRDIGKMPPLIHYARIGRGERRDPGPGFGVSEYLATYPDVAAEGIDPLEHYIRHGRAEGRVAFRSARGLGALAPADPMTNYALHVPNETLLRIVETTLRRETRVEG